MRKHNWGIQTWTNADLCFFLTLEPACPEKKRNEEEKNTEQRIEKILMYLQYFCFEIILQFGTRNFLSSSRGAPGEGKNWGITLESIPNSQKGKGGILCFTLR